MTRTGMAARVKYRQSLFCIRHQRLLMVHPVRDEPQTIPQVNGAVIQQETAPEPLQQFPLQADIPLCVVLGGQGRRRARTGISGT